VPDRDGRHKKSSSRRLGRCQKFCSCYWAKGMAFRCYAMHVVKSFLTSSDTQNAFFQVSQGAALARWVFINPCCIVRANKYAKREFKQCPKGFDKCTKDGRDTFDTFLSQADVAKLSRFLGKDPDTRSGGACACWMIAPGGELARLCEDSMGHNGSRAHGSLHDHMAACACKCHQIRCSRLHGSHGCIVGRSAFHTLKHRMLL